MHMRDALELDRRGFLKKSAGMAALAMGGAALLGAQQAWADDKRAGL
jgi:hypothetical protein